MRAQKPFWSDLTKQIIGRLEKAGTVAVDVDEVFSVAEGREDFNRVMLPEWNRAIWTGVSFEAQWIESAEISTNPLETQKVETVDLENPLPPPSINVDPSEELQAAVRRFLQERRVGVWDQVGKTTRDRLRRAIQRGLAEGDTLDDMTTRIKRVMRSQSAGSARRIARTESTAGMNSGQQSERDDIGIESKQWVSTIDNLTRQNGFDHVSADGQVVKNTQPFIVSGEELMFPADSSRGASAGNIIHCRCAGVASFD